MSRGADIGLAIVFLALIDGMNQRQLAKKAGVGVSTITAWRKGRSPSQRTMRKVLPVLRRTQDEVDRLAAIIGAFRPARRQAAGASSYQAADLSHDLAEVGGGPVHGSEDEQLREIGRAVRRLAVLLTDPLRRAGLEP
jgi:transcriptional regulator with XRE-family HTH domain